MKLKIVLNVFLGFIWCENKNNKFTLNVNLKK